MTALKAVRPEQVAKRAKMFWFGPPNSWKTSVSIQFPSPYLIDTERGAENEQYTQALAKAGGVYLFTTDMDEIIEQVGALLTEKHNYRTIVIDPITVPYAEACDKAARELAAQTPGTDGTEYGRHKARADRKMKRLCGMLLRLDMNVILTAHAKTKWEKVGDGFKEGGTTFDAYNKLEYLFDLVMETQLRGSEGWAVVRKTRLVRFGIGDSFQFTYANIADRYGLETLERGAEPILLANPERVERLQHLVDTVKLDAEIVQKWLDKADVESFAEMPASIVEKCIAFVEARVSGQEVKP